MGIAVRVLDDFHCFYEIREPNEPLIPGIRFRCERQGQAEPTSPNHSKVWWVSEAEFRGIGAGEFIPGVKEQVSMLFEEYKARAQ